MKIRTTALVAGLLLAGATTIAQAQDAPKGPPPQQGEPGQREGGQRPPRGEGGPGGPEGAQRQRRAGGPNLEAAMKTMGGSLKALKANVGDASKKDECLKAVSMFQYGVAASKAAPLPGNVGKGMDDAAKAKLDSQFRAELRELMATSIKLEDAIIAGKTDEAKSLVNKLNEMREKGHKDMGLKDED